MNPSPQQRVCRNILVATINEAVSKGLIQLLHRSDPEWPAVALSALEAPVLGAVAQFDFIFADTAFFAIVKATEDGLRLVVVAGPRGHGRHSVAVGRVFPDDNYWKDGHRALYLSCEAFVGEGAVPQMLTADAEEPRGYVLFPQ